MQYTKLNQQDVKPKIWIFGMKMFLQCYKKAVKLPKRFNIPKMAKVTWKDQLTETTFGECLLKRNTLFIYVLYCVILYDDSTIISVIFTVENDRLNTLLGISVIY